MKAAAHVDPAAAPQGDDGPADASRRRLLKGVGLSLAVGLAGDVCAQAASAPAAAASGGNPTVGPTATPPPKFGGDLMPGGVVDNPLVFVSIAPDGIVTVVCHRSEMGQGVRTSVAMVVADELDADWSKVRVKQAPGDEARYGNQNTDGSRSLRHSMEPLRRVGASARAMLEAAAAARWGVPADQVKARNHELVHAPTGRKLGYGDVAAAAATLPIPVRETLRLKAPAEFRYIGKGDIALVDGSDMVRGRAVYGADVRLDGMVYAVVARPPVLGGQVKSFDPAKALAVPGVLRVVELKSTPLPAAMNPLGGIAVVGRNTWAALKGREALSRRMGRRRARQVRLAGLQGHARSRGARAGQGGAQRGRRRRRAGAGVAPRRGRVLPAASGARRHGAAGGDRAHRRRQVRGVGAGAGAAGGAQQRRRAPGAQARAGDGAT